MIELYFTLYHIPGNGTVVETLKQQCEKEILLILVRAGFVMSEEGVVAEDLAAGI